MINQLQIRLLHCFVLLLLANVAVAKETEMRELNFGKGCHDLWTVLPLALFLSIEGVTILAIPCVYMLWKSKRKARLRADRRRQRGEVDTEMEKPRSRARVSRWRAPFSRRHEPEPERRQTRPTFDQQQPLPEQQGENKEQQPPITPSPGPGPPGGVQSQWIGVA